MTSSTYDYVDWMEMYARNRELEIYDMPGGADPFCFLRVPHAADNTLLVHERQHIGETNIVCLFCCFLTY